MQSLISVGGEFWIDNNDVLTDITPLNNLTTIGQSLYIVNNEVLISLNGLGSINPNSILSLNIYNNPLLSECNVQSICDYLASPNGTVVIGNNAPGCNSQAEVLEACETLSCLPEGITFTTQEQIDNFQTNYPNCTEIEGNVFIAGIDISNLNGLIVITSILGDLNVGGYQGTGNALLTNLEGLDSLTFIGGDLMIYYNLSLTSLTGLEALNAIGGSLIIGDWYWGWPQITNLQGLEGLNEIGGSLLIEPFNQLTSLEGLENLAFIGGDLYLHDQEALITMTGLNNLTSIGGDLDIRWINNMVNLNGLESLISIGGNLRISDNGLLTSLQGLENLTSINGYLWIFGNSVPNLIGLDNIDAGSINELRIYCNNILSTCEVQSICDYLAAPNGTIEIHDNAPGCNSPEEVQEACMSCLPEGIQFLSQYDIDNFQANYPGCTEIGGNVHVGVVEGPSDISDLEGLNVLTSIGGSLTIGNTQNLFNLNGLNGLTSIGGSLRIGWTTEPSFVYGNNLTSLIGLEALNSIGGDLEVSANAYLTGISALSNLNSVSGGIKIARNYDSLTSITGLDNINPGTISELGIFLNFYLSTCDVLSICNYLASPNAQVNIENNAPGCNSPEEVETACAITTVEEIKGGKGITIIPNPSNDKITISSSAITGNTFISLFNVNGEKVIGRQLNEQEIQIDISALPQGVYVVRLQNEKMVEVEKIIKE